MPDLTSYQVFLAASIALILVPRPAQALVIAKTLLDTPWPLDCGWRRSNVDRVVKRNLWRGAP